MSIRVITIDFWNTLYKHKGSASARKSIRDKLLLERCLELGYEDCKDVSGTFFDVVNDYIKRQWASGRKVEQSEVIKHCLKIYRNRYSKEIFETLLEELYYLYTTELKPVSYPQSKKFLEWARDIWPLYLISDTYTIVGSVIDNILRSDNYFDLFIARYYSDILGVQKPNPMAIEKIIDEEKISPKQIVHIGDLWERDHKMSLLAGCKFILLIHDSKNKNKQENTENNSLLGICTSFAEVRKLLEIHK